jgi:hypothetical protein
MARHFTVVALVGLFFSCTPTNRLIVHEAKLGDKVVREVGLDYDLTHVPTTGFTGQKPGYYIVHSGDDWLALWEEARPDHSKVPVAPAIDWKTTMAIAAISGDPDAISYDITRVIKLERTLYVYIEESLPGQQCKGTRGKNPMMDIVTVPTSDLDVSIHLERDPSDSCGAAPEVAVKCKVSGQSGEGGNKVLATPGQSIECDGRHVVIQGGTIADRNWFLDTRPPGSFAQLTVDPKEEFAKFTVDAYGSYAVREEALDDQEKRGEAAAFIDVAPPMDASLVQLGWTKYDPKDDPSTFPRYELHVVEMPFRMGTNKDCTEDAPKQPWCEVKTSGYVKQVRLKPAAKTRYKAIVKYVDDRFAGAPVLCFRSFLPGLNGAAYRTLDVCDDTIRKAGTEWEPGAFDFDTGGFEDPNKPHVSAVVSSSDGGVSPADGGH